MFAEQGHAAQALGDRVRAASRHRGPWPKVGQTHYPLDPDAVIASAFKAAGLAVPEIPTAPPGTTPRVEPGPIIAAALKAAGLIRS
jgi:hypothetical protein